MRNFKKILKTKISSGRVPANLDEGVKVLSTRPGEILYQSWTKFQHNPAKSSAYGMGRNRENDENPSK